MKKNKVIQWESNIDNKDYLFTYERKKGTLEVNNEIIEIKRESISIYLGTDMPFTFDGKEARFVHHRKKIDVFYEGYGLQSGQAYEPIPKWGFIFIGICLLLPVFSGGLQTIFTAIIGFIGLFFYRIIAKKRPSLMICDVIISLSILRGGAIPILFGLMGADLCLKISRNKMATLNKILLCTLVSIMTWVVLFIVLVMIRIIVYLF